MSLLSSFIRNQLIKAIENEFINHSPEIQATIVSEIQAFLAEGAAWVDNKLGSNPSTGENES